MPSFGTRLGTRLGTKLGTQWPADGASAPPTPLQILQTALGADLVALWEVPATDDSTIDVISGRIDRLASLVGGNALQAAAAINRPLYTTYTEGLGGEPCLEIDGTDIYMDAALTVAAANRAALYAVIRPNLGNGNGNKITVTTFSGTDDSTIGYGNTTAQHRAKYAFTTAGEVQLIHTAPGFFYDQWSLHSVQPRATGALSQVDGVTGTPNFAVSETGRAIATARVGFTSISGSGQVKLFAVVTNISAAYDTAMKAYVAARWPLVGQRLSRIVIGGQSNAERLVMTDFPEVPGYTSARSAASGQAMAYFTKGVGAGYAPLLAELAKAPPTKRPVLVWIQGESDSDTAPEAAAYQAARLQLKTDLETDLGRTDLFEIELLFHADFLANGTYPHATTVNNAKIAYVASQGADAVTLDPNNYGGPGSTVDNVHWGPDGGPSSALQLAMLDAIHDTIIAAGLL